MSFLQTVEKARAFLERNGRVSLRALQREFDLDDDSLGELIEELAEVQRVAVRDGSVLAWSDGVPPAPTEAAEYERDPRACTPKHLADKILQSRSALEGERKQVSVLFADVKGSMELAEQLDPEEWHTILDRFFAILTDGVHRFEGTVNQYTGDGIMALFGAPIAHEDHAQRACYAALHMRDALKRYADEQRRTAGVSLSVRIGLNSGEVVVGRIGDDLRMDYTAQGHTVGLAQRMEQRAAADSTYLTAYTARLVEGYFQLRDLGEFNLKGVSAPLRTYELQGVGSLRTRLDVSRSRGFSKFVGREREMSTLEGALDAAIGGRGQVVGVVAEAGTGKSRLCLEFVERCRARGVRVNEGHCPAHGKTIPYLPLLEMLRDIFGIAERDNDHEARRKIAGELLLLDEAFQELLPILFDFMGVADPTRPAPAMSPEGRQQKLFAFMRHLTDARSAHEPTVLFLDDLHWIDPGSDAFLAHSIAAVQNTRTLWLVNFRPEYQAEWMRKPYYQQLPLLPLGPQAIGEMLADLLGGDPSVQELPAYVHQRTGGNPFFIEEVVQSLMEGGSLKGSEGAYRLVSSVDAIEIPATVQTVLAARIDRLGEDEKQALQTASVIGKEFSGAILAAVVAADERGTLSSTGLAVALNALREAEFIHETALYPEVEYAFKHPLTQEVAYRSQLGARRAQVHAAVARAVEQMEEDKLDAHAALLAYHWEHGGDAVTAGRWYARAAAVAGLDSPAEALRHWDKVRAILAPAVQSEESVALRLRAASELLILSWRQGMDSDRVDEIFADGKSLAVARGDVREQVRLLYGIGLYYMLNGAPRRVIPLFEESLALADAARDPELRWAALQPVCLTLTLLGDLAEALQRNDELIELSGADPAIGIAMISLSIANSYSHRGWTLTDLGRFDEAAAMLRRGEETARRFNENEVMSWNDGLSARLWERTGDVEAALSAGRRAVESAEKIGSVLARAFAHGCYGAALGLSADWQAARQSLELSLEIARTRRVGLFSEASFLAALAEAHLGLGDAPRARELADEAIQAALRMEMRGAEAQAQLALARVLRAVAGADGSAGIETALDRALALVRSTGAGSYEPQICVERARLAALRSDASGAQQWLREAHHLFTEMGARGHAQRLAEELG